MIPVVVTLVEITVLSFVLTGLLLLVLLKLRFLPGLEKGDSLYSLLRALLRQPEQEPHLYVRDSKAWSPMAAALLVSIYLSSATVRTTYTIAMAPPPTVRVVDQTTSSDSASNLIIPLAA
jgi:hypothetical protein